MYLPNIRPFRGWKRSGIFLVWFVVLLPALVGMVGLVIDTGIMLAAHRHAHATADAASQAAAVVLWNAKQPNQQSADQSKLETAAQNYVDKNAPDAQTPVVNWPPQAPSVPSHQTLDYVEVIVTVPMKTYFIQVVGVNPNQQVVARAVAGIEAVPENNLVVVLDPNASPNGLQVGGNALLLVSGGIAVNTTGTGAVDDNGVQSPQPSAKSQNADTVYAEKMKVVGGVNNPNYFNLVDATDPNNPQKTTTLLGNKLLTEQLPITDPFSYLNVPTPTVSNGGVPSQGGNPLFGGTSEAGNFQSPQNLNIQVPKSSEPPIRIFPGVYNSISVGGGKDGTVIFDPGIYILKGGGLDLSASNGTIRTDPSGVMFYNTGNNFIENTGFPDSNDLNNVPGSGNFGGNITIGHNVQLSPLDSPGSPFDNFLFYQRRWNRNDITINGKGVNLSGAIYAKWAQFNVTANASGVFNSQIVVGSMKVEGSATIIPRARDAVLTWKIYLVE